LKLLNALFVVVKNSVCEVGFITIIKLNPDHIVYTGHFPGHPVTPAVVQMQIVHELLENHLGRKLKLVSMPQCKFLAILDPIKIPQVTIHIEIKKVEELIEIKALGKNDTWTFFKLNAVYGVNE
jgi:3-hydroxyacyl-[acyl-carrier-protein] dehydratase